MSLYLLYEKGRMNQKKFLSLFVMEILMYSIFFKLLEKRPELNDLESWMRESVQSTESVFLKPWLRRKVVDHSILI